MQEYDAIVVGSGTAGQTAAYDLREKNLRTALIEKSDSPGGTCALSGCQPKKWFYEMTELMARSKHLKGKGILAPPKALWSEILEQKNKFTRHIPDGTVEGLVGAGIDFYEGAAEFVEPDTVQAGNDSLKARYFVLATGASPVRLPIDGNRYIKDNVDFLGLEVLPERIFFVGGGFVSFEFAHFAAALGPENREIIIGEAAERPLGPFDSEMVDLLVKASEEEGITVLPGLDIKAVGKEKKGYAVTTGSGKKFETDLVVHGAGRAADLEGLCLDRAGVEYSGKGIAVDENMRTSNPAIYAIGDCAATAQLARVADCEAHVAARNISAELLGGEQARIDYNTVPALLFTYPQYGMVGKTEDALKKESVEYRKSFAKNLGWPTYKRVGMKHAAYKILVGPDNRILGAHFLSDNASGLVNTVKMAMLNNLGADELYRQSIMTPYPTRESDIIYMLDPFK